MRTSSLMRFAKHAILGTITRFMKIIWASTYHMLLINLSILSYVNYPNSRHLNYLIIFQLFFPTADNG